MKKTLLLSAAILMLGTSAANAGSFSFSFFAPVQAYEPVPVYYSQPVYVQPQPTYVVSSYPVVYSNPYPVYYSTYWYDKHGRKHWNHDRHDRDRHDRDRREHYRY